MQTSGSGHSITLEPSPRRWRALFRGHVIADTGEALILREGVLPPVVYFPRRDVSLEYMGRTARQTHCPFKGDAAYYTLTMDGEILENVAWTYEHPIDAMERIAGRIAFYPGEIEIYQVDDAVVNPPHHDRRTEAQAAVRDETYNIAEIIQHTDSGDGVSQREHWPPNVSSPTAERSGR